MAMYNIPPTNPIGAVMAAVADAAMPMLISAGVQLISECISGTPQQQNALPQGQRPNKPRAFVSMKLEFPDGVTITERWLEQTRSGKTIHCARYSNGIVTKSFDELNIVHRGR